MKHTNRTGHLHVLLNLALALTLVLATALALFTALATPPAQAAWTDLTPPQPGLARLDLPGGAGPLALAEGAPLLAAGSRADKRLHLIDLATGRLLKQLSLPGYPTALAVNRDGTRVYALLAESDQVVVVDATRGRIHAQWPTGVELASLLLHGDELLLGTRDGRLLGLNALDGRRLRDKALDLPPGRLALGLDGLRILAAAGSQLIHLDAATWTEIRRIGLPGDIVGLDWWSHGGRALALARHGNDLNLVDAENGELDYALGVCTPPAGLALDPDNRGQTTINLAPS